MPARRCTPLGPSPPFQTLADEARSTYTDVRENVYRFGAKGTVANETSFPCDCVAGPDGDNCDERCFNRQLYIECVECPCGSLCQNRRFQQKEWAKVNVVKTKEKGFGLTAVDDMKSGQLVMEYVGEVLPREQFLQRVIQYSEHGLRHFYFMELKKDEVIDATQRGCLARFINHSCAPNCTLQKWVVGNQSRMGIFTSKKVARGQELTFDYKFERYGAKAQVCYCGEDACTGYIGGEKGEKREVDKIDEELEADTENNDPRVPIISNGLEFDEIPKCVQLMHRTQQRPQWALVLLRSLNLTSCPRALSHFRQLKGLPLLNAWLNMYRDDTTVIKRILEFLPNIHIVDRRTVQDENNVENTGIEFGVGKFINHEDTEIVQQAKKILDTWGQLERSTKIPKKRKSISSADDNENKRQRQLPPWAIEAQQAHERQIKEEEERRQEIRTANAEAARIMAERIATANAERRRREREEREAEIEANRVRNEEAKRQEEERRKIEDEARRLGEERRVEEEERKRAEKEREAAAELDAAARKHQKKQHHHNLHNGHGHSKTNSKHRHHGQNHNQRQEKSDGHSSKHNHSQRHSTHHGSHQEVPSRSYHEKSAHTRSWSEKSITIDGNDGVKLRRVIAEAVTKHMSKYTGDFQSTERFKRHAGDVTQILVDKELKKEQEKIEMNEQKWNKIRLFVKEYAEKVVSRLHVKEGSETKAKSPMC